jgi:hypothetical protein
MTIPSIPFLPGGIGRVPDPYNKDRFPYPESEDRLYRGE